MRVVAVKRAICSVALVSVMGWANHAQAQLAVGTTWARTDGQGMGITMSVEACCNGGLRLVYHLPPMAGQPASTMSVDSAMNGTDAPTLVGGKPSAQTMAIKRVDDHHYSAVLKTNGKPMATATATVSPDGKTMTVESVTEIAGASQKITETWVRK